MQFTHLSTKFHEDYPSIEYPEMMTKDDRPYTQIITDIDGLKFAVPLRSDIKHNGDVLWTNKELRHGLDFTKAVLILDDNYLTNDKAYIRNSEYKHLIGKDYRVKEKMEKCISNYKKAKADIDKAHNAEYCKYSTLQYFEDYIYNNK